jgi:WD40 repeat protein
VAFSPNGKYIAASRAQAVEIRDADSGKLLRTLIGHTDMVYSVEFSPNGRLLVAGSGDKSVRLWDATTGKTLRRLRGHRSSVNSVAFSPDGNQIVSGSDDNSIRVWDARTGSDTLTLVGHEGEVVAVVFSPCGKWIASGSSDETVRVWDARTGRELITLEELTIGATVSFTPDSKWLVVGNFDGQVNIWDVSSGEKLHQVDQITNANEGNVSAPVYGLAIDNTGSRLAVHLKERVLDHKFKLKRLLVGIKVWDLSIAGGAIVASKTPADPPAGVRPAKQPTTTKPVALARNPATGRALLTLKGHSGSVLSVAFSPDGKRLASASTDKTVRVWNAATGQEVFTLEGHSGWVESVAFSSDGKRLASASRDKTVKVWDAATGRELLTLQGHTGDVRSVSFSPDGNRLASASGDKTVRMWRASTGQQLHTLKGHSEYIASVAFSPDGKWLASASGDMTVKLWDTSTGQEILSLKGHTATVFGVSFSPNGKRLASASLDKTVSVRETSTGKQLLTLRGHTDEVLDVKFSPDGRILASAGGYFDKTVKVWDASTGQELLTLRGHTDRVMGVSFNPDGKWLASASWEGTVRIWETTPRPDRTSSRDAVVARWLDDHTIDDLLPFTWSDVVAHVGRGPLVETGMDRGRQFVLYHLRFKVVRHWWGIEVFFSPTKDGLAAGTAFMTSKLFKKQHQNSLLALLELRPLGDKPKHKDIGRIRVAVSQATMPGHWIRLTFTPREWNTTPTADAPRIGEHYTYERLHLHPRYGEMNKTLRSIMTGRRERVYKQIQLIISASDYSGWTNSKLRELLATTLQRGRKLRQAPGVSVQAFSSGIFAGWAALQGQFESWNRQ